MRRHAQAAETPSAGARRKLNLLVRRHLAIALVVGITIGVFAIVHHRRAAPLSPPAVGAELRCPVATVSDGDTIVMRCAQGRLKVRLWGIDAPETRQKPWGGRAREQLIALLEPASEVRAAIVDHDRYGRTVARLSIARRDVGLAMVAQGHAVVYRRYNQSAEYLNAERGAKAGRLGIWAKAGPHQDPAAWRRVNPLW